MIIIDRWLNSKLYNNFTLLVLSNMQDHIYMSRLQNIFFTPTI